MLHLSARFPIARVMILLLVDVSELGDGNRRTFNMLLLDDRIWTPDAQLESGRESEQKVSNCWRDSAARPPPVHLHFHSRPTKSPPISADRWLRLPPLTLDQYRVTYSPHRSGLWHAAIPVSHSIPLKYGCNSHLNPIPMLYIQRNQY